MALRAAKFDPILRFWRLRGANPPKWLYGTCIEIEIVWTGMQMSTQCRAPTPQDDLKFFGGGVCVGERVRRGVASLKFSRITCENKENSRL